MEQEEKKMMEYTATIQEWKNDVLLASEVISQYYPFTLEELEKYEVFLDMWALSENVMIHYNDKIRKKLGNELLYNCWIYNWAVGWNKDMLRLFIPQYELDISLKKVAVFWTPELLELYPHVWFSDISVTERNRQGERELQNARKESIEKWEELGFGDIRENEKLLFLREEVNKFFQEIDLRQFLYEKEENERFILQQNGIPDIKEESPSSWKNTLMKEIDILNQIRNRKC